MWKLFAASNFEKAPKSQKQLIISQMKTSGKKLAWPFHTKLLLKNVMMLQASTFSRRSVSQNPHARDILWNVAMYAVPAKRGQYHVSRPSRSTTGHAVPLLQRIYRLEDNESERDNFLAVLPENMVFGTSGCRESHSHGEKRGADRRHGTKETRVSQLVEVMSKRKRCKR